ncbi:MAG: radical SAM family heme chaperone HemW [Muribaculaceae bacterium]|nr:radical SAM family heme chaperone HemW [Muribaculaceae bacterium]
MPGVYIHIPFCRRRCLYCDFYSVGEPLAPWTRFVDSLLREATVRLPDFIKDNPGDTYTLYIGGGTPSLIPEEEFLRLTEGIRALMPVPVEFTIEVNPDDVTPLKADVWQRAGVNRISMGVQSMIDAELQAVGRRHSAEDARSAYSILSERFANISLDLIFGLPGQTLESLSRSLEEIIAMKPKHVSVYSLMYEERSALTRLRDAGRIDELPEQYSVAMFRVINEQLSEAGIRRYEISNYAIPGYESRHNSAYWRGDAYIGLGPAAHGFDGRNLRRANAADFRKYMQAVSDDFIDEGSGLFGNEMLDEDELREEMIMTRLRTTAGLDTEAFKTRFGEPAYRRLMRDADRWMRSGRLTMGSGSHLTLTDAGVMISDEIIADLF